LLVEARSTRAMATKGADHDKTSERRRISSRESGKATRRKQVKNIRARFLLSTFFFRLDATTRAL
jgi:hypothetical protein